MTQLVVRIPVDLRHEALNANGRQHWAVIRARTKMLRDKSRAFHHRFVHVEGWQAPEHAHLTVFIAWPSERRRDAANLSPTFKAMIDGAVDAGVLADDDDRHLTGPDPRVHPTLSGNPGVALLTFVWEAS